MRKSVGIVLCLLCVAGLLIGCFDGNSALNQMIGETQGMLRGRVTIGPLCPVEPCQLTDEQVASVYQAHKVLVYVSDSEAPLVQKTLGPDGSYALWLDPGEYIVDVSDANGQALPLDPLQRPLIGNTRPRTVEIVAGREIVLDFDIDTGIR